MKKRINVRVPMALREKILLSKSIGKMPQILHVALNGMSIYIDMKMKNESSANFIDVLLTFQKNINYRVFPMKKGSFSMSFYLEKREIEMIEYIKNKLILIKQSDFVDINMNESKINYGNIICQSLWIYFSEEDYVNG